MKKLEGVHICYGDEQWGNWRILENQDAVIRLSRIQHLLTDDKIKTVKHGEICWKGMDMKSELFHGQNPKYTKADISFPCILLENAPNPRNMKYRMIDGKYRIAKKNAMRMKKSEFYVLDFHEIKQYIDTSEEALENVRLYRIIAELRTQIMMLTNGLSKASIQTGGGVGPFGMIKH